MTVRKTTRLRVSRTECPPHDLLEHGRLPGPTDGVAAILRHVPGHAVHGGDGGGHGVLHHAARVAVARVVHQVTLVVKL